MRWPSYLVRYLIHTAVLTIGVLAAAPARADEPGGVYLHVASPSTVTIERDDTGEVVCTSPCDTTVPAGARYRVGGHRPSGAFVLEPAASGRADVRVRPGSPTSFWTGIGALGLGAALIAGGVATLIYGYQNQAPVQGADGVDTDNSYTDAMIIGTSLVLGGVVAGLWGGANVVSNASTKVRGDLVAAPKSSPAVTRQAVLGLPRSTFVTVLGVSF